MCETLRSVRAGRGAYMSSDGRACMHACMTQDHEAVDLRTAARKHSCSVVGPDPIGKSEYFGSISEWQP